MDKDKLKEIMFDQKDVFNRKKHLIGRAPLTILMIYKAPAKPKS